MNKANKEIAKHTTHRCSTCIHAVSKGEIVCDPEERGYVYKWGINGQYGLTRCSG
jgi:hypothetical protein